ncbi:Alpha-L-rhamnosidase N-terminal domain-containing protein [Algoriphagus locisalis]|uniref:Alpha-L-rhamnosidase N-terminal domain-containing protein n=1 Tax=Algoriphagus locisalis TaxID=305507 RepID=A0A1I7E7T5_9BACT|nr:family 78 glycoside hydrolase catalytic domain [Algoriphagus locisalis]SFU20008.1 Alpha-L-rhamnosidase N-terminal domain-containing protein [Algoriphagus locisalis]
MAKKYLSILILFLIPFVVQSQTNEDAPWISYPSANVTDYGVYHFRKAFDLKEIPTNLNIHVSADNRYNLFVNGHRVSYGPAKGDLETYKYDIVDIAPYLVQGENVIAALVYNGGKDRPLAFISVQTAFMLDVENTEYAFLRTDTNWKVFKNPAYSVISYDEMLFSDQWFYGFYACGGGDHLDGNQYPWGWEEIQFDESGWLNAERLHFEGSAPWNLVPRNIPFMADHIVYPARIRENTGFTEIVGAWNGSSKITIPANLTASILIDFDLLTMGYPELTVSGGENSSIKIKYAEALYEGVNLKAHRDSVSGKTMFGVWDIFETDGNGSRTFRPLWKRAFRYVKLEIETKEEPLDILSFLNEYSGYPYPEMATFVSNDQTLNEIFTNSQRTFQMCSAETYYDTPYYEQLNYGGDNRPIASISTYNSLDDRLLREMLRLYAQSENTETSLFKSAYPSTFDFDQGSWSMAWIQTLLDYYLIRGDDDFIIPFVENIEKILSFYDRHLDEKTGLIGVVNNQNFIDWSIGKGSLPRSNEQKEMIQSTMLTLYFAHTLDCTVRLFNEIGLEEKSKRWALLSEGIKSSVLKASWDEQKQLFTDYPGGDIFSQQTNILAILCDVVPENQQKELLNRILSYDGFDEMASSYFSFFLFKAMQKTDQEDLFLENLDFWYDFLARGLTTTGETGFATHDRSDSHAWSAHPAYYMLNSVCGIKPAEVGFKSVVISPHLGSLTSVKATMPHTEGLISVTYEISGNELNASIELPKNLNGTWEYNGEVIALKGGLNKIKQSI